MKSFFEKASPSEFESFLPYLEKDLNQKRAKYREEGCRSSFSLCITEKHVEKTPNLTELIDRVVVLPEIYPIITGEMAHYNGVGVKSAKKKFKKEKEVWNYSEEEKIIIKKNLGIENKNVIVKTGFENKTELEKISKYLTNKRSTKKLKRYLERENNRDLINSDKKIRTQNYRLAKQNLEKILSPSPSNINNPLIVIEL